MWLSTHMTEQIVNITTRQVAELAHVDSSTVRRWVDTGVLKPSLRTPGGHYRFDPREVARALSPVTR